VGDSREVPRMHRVLPEEHQLDAMGHIQSAVSVSSPSEIRRWRWLAGKGLESFTGGLPDGREAKAKAKATGERRRRRSRM
jgi:hypothetical protein